MAHLKNNSRLKEQLLHQGALLLVAQHHSVLPVENRSVECDSEDTDMFTGGA
ncbi:MAG: hypothetical protein WC045_04060 [Patescibacteria group bacterium]